jgi:hypothetical protein
MKVVNEESGEPLNGLTENFVIVYVLATAISLAENLLAINRLGRPAPDKIIAHTIRMEVLQRFRELADKELGSLFPDV